MNQRIAAIHANPRYQAFIRSRARFSWAMTLLMLVVYFGFIFLVAFNREFLARPIGGGVTTLSIPIGIGLIVFTVILTSLYVWRANSVFDARAAEILKEIP